MDFGMVAGRTGWVLVTGRKDIDTDGETQMGMVSDMLAGGSVMHTDCEEVTGKLLQVMRSERVPAVMRTLQKASVAGASSDSSADGTSWGSAHAKYHCWYLSAGTSLAVSRIRCHWENPGCFQLLSRLSLLSN